MANESRNFEYCVEDLYRKALDVYKETDEGKALNKKLFETEKNLQEKISKEEFAFVINAVGIHDIKGEQEGKFLYRQGIKDCISLLRYIGLL